MSANQPRQERLTSSTSQPLLDQHESSVDLHDHARPEPDFGDHDDSAPSTIAARQLHSDLPGAALRSPQSFRHSGWATIRNRVYDALNDCCMPMARLRRFAQCGEFAWVVADKTDPRHVALVGSYCRDRFCTPCATARSRYIAAQIAKHTGNDRLRMVTLTIKTGDGPLAGYLAKLRESFRRLRQTSLWASCIRGGAAFLEVKFNFETHRWHPHYHILAVGKFMAAKALSKAWLKATGDSYIIHIAECNSPEKARTYVTKYATKAIDNETLRSPTRLREAITQLHGKRTLLLFGDWRRIRLTRERLTTEWVHLTSLRSLLKLIRRGNHYAQEVMAALLTTSRLRDELPLPRALASSTRSPPVKVPSGVTITRQELFATEPGRKYDLTYVTEV